MRIEREPVRYLYLTPNVFGFGNTHINERKMMLINDPTPPRIQFHCMKDAAARSAGESF